MGPHDEPGDRVHVIWFGQVFHGVQLFHNFCPGLAGSNGSSSFQCKYHEGVAKHVIWHIEEVRCVLLFFFGGFVRFEVYEFFLILDF